MDNQVRTTKARIRLEAVVASPPTGKCQMTIEMMENMVKLYPDQLRLDIYYDGIEPAVAPTRSYILSDKYKVLPSSFVNGNMVSAAKVPDPEDLRQEIEKELKKGEEAWL